jgi:hypothetical protein
VQLLTSGCSATRFSSASTIHGTTTRHPASTKAEVTADPKPPVPPVINAAPLTAQGLPAAG